jgi:hypothetical protein
VMVIDGNRANLAHNWVVAQMDMGTPCCE